MAEQKKKPEQRQIKIEIDNEVADGTYANLSMIASNNSEFIFDFARFLPGNTRGKVVSRVVLHPVQAKAFLRSLNEAVDRFEASFGAITPEPAHKDLGFSMDMPDENFGKA